MSATTNNQFDQQALMGLLGEKPAKAAPGLPDETLLMEKPAYNKAPAGGSVMGQASPNDAPTSHTMPAPSVSGPSAPPQVSPQVFQGFTPRYAMEGFDFNREQNTGKSAKDAFAYLANQAPPPPLNDKAALQAWAEHYIVPGMKALGHNVSNVQGDKFHLQNWQGDFDVDYGRGAGADGGALAWQVDDGTAQMPANASYTPRGVGAPMMPPPAQDDTMAAILNEIEALQRGGASPMDQQALMELL